MLRPDQRRAPVRAARFVRVARGPRLRQSEGRDRGQDERAEEPCPVSPPRTIWSCVHHPFNIGTIGAARKAASLRNRDEVLYSTL